MPRWLLHTVGGADLGVPLQDQPLLERRVRAAAALADDELPERLAALRWPGPTTGVVAPLAALAGNLPTDEPVRLLLLCTEFTRHVAAVIAGALARRPTLYGAAFATVQPVLIGPPGHASGGLAERDTVAAVGPHLRPAGASDRAWITWGSGSTQLAFGAVEAATAAGVPWSLLGLDERNGPLGELVPEMDVRGPDPIVPLLRRWRCHDDLLVLTRTATLGLSAEQRRVIEDDARTRHFAHTTPTASGLRLLVSDAVVKQDITSAFPIRRYVLARYHELRAGDPDQPVDLEAWAVGQANRAGDSPTLGGVLSQVERAVRAGRPAQVCRSAATPSGRWLLSATAKALNAAGNATHRMTPMPRGQLNKIISHFDGRTEATDTCGLPSVTGGPAVTAWYLRVMGVRADPPGHDLLSAVAADGVDKPVADHLGWDPASIPCRFLLLGSSGPAAAVACDAAAALPGAEWTEIPVDGSPEWDTTAADELLRRHFGPIESEVGAIVIIPTGRKATLLPLLIAAHRLARRQGIPLYLRHLNERDAMHQLPMRFGALTDLLTVAADRLSTIELDLAARLLDTCADQRAVADAVRALAKGLFCRGTPPTGVDNRVWSLGLLDQRLEVWARLAIEQSNGAATVSRALFGAAASVECSVRAAAALGHDPKSRWTRFRTALDRDSHPAAQLLRLIRSVRNDLPTSHGDPGELDDLVRTTAARFGFPGAAGLSAATLIALAAHQARQWPFLASAPRFQDRLADQFVALRRTIEHDVEQDRHRQDRQAVATGLRVLTELADSDD